VAFWATGYKEQQMTIYIAVRPSLSSGEKEIRIEVESINSNGDTETDVDWITKDMLLAVLSSGEDK
jgi:hypothetical protein